jgi:HEPN domain-containing protein
VRAETQRWLAMADEDWAAALLLNQAGWRTTAVFHIHLCVEKTLKALIIERGSLAPYSHRLRRLASLTSATMPAGFQEFLDTLSPEGVRARYSSSSEYDVSYVARLLEEAEEVVAWLKQQLT